MVPFLLDGVYVVLHQLYDDLSIEDHVASAIYDMTREARSRTFPGDLGKYAVREEKKYRDTHPGATDQDILDVRQEYLVAEILEMSGNSSMDDLVDMITSRHILRAIRNDPELNDLLKDLVKLYL